MRRRLGLPLCIALASCGTGDEVSGTGIDASLSEHFDLSAEAFVPSDAATDIMLDTNRCTGAPYPIVLHHGFFGFESVAGIRYWYRVADALRDEGEDVTETLVDPFNDSLVRAEELSHQIDEVLARTGACKVAIVAHSQGGVDARALISRLGYADRVAARVTVATPHRGTRVAELVDGSISGWGEGAANFLADLASQVLGPGASESDLVAAMRALSPAAMEAFNAETPDEPSVPIFSVGGRSLSATGNSVCADSVWPNPGGTDLIDPLLIFSATYLKEDLWSAGKANDGMVTVESAIWGTFLGCIAADHFDEIGQIADRGVDLVSGFDHLEFYRRIVTYLHERGF